MIDAYIEKDIMRQIKIVEFLFELKQINVHKTADFLGVSRMTIKRDIEKILLLDSRIRLVEKKYIYITVRFTEGATRYELIKKLYEQSYFLKTSARYLMNETNYLKISENEHISVAKVFSLKKKVEEFFKVVGIMSEDGFFLEDEFNYRLITVAIWMRTNAFDKIIDRRTYREAEKIAERLIQTFSNNLSYREKYFLSLNIYLTLKRKKKKLKIPESDFSFVYQGASYSTIKSLLLRYNLEENSIAYIAIAYRMLSQNLNNNHFLEIEYFALRDNYIKQIPEVTELIQIFEQKFNQELMKDMMFEKPFINLLMSIFLKQSMFLVEKHYFLNNTQQILCRRIENILTDWSQKHGFKLFLDIRSIEKFCLQTSGVLLANPSKNWHIFIVAEDEISHISYRESIRRRMNTEYIVIDTLLYYSLDQLPIYIDIANSIIICERSLGEFPFDQYRGTQMFPVSLYSLNEDLQNIFNYISNFNGE